VVAGYAKRETFFGLDWNLRGGKSIGGDDTLLYFAALHPLPTSTTYCCCMLLWALFVEYCTVPAGFRERRDLLHPRGGPIPGDLILLFIIYLSFPHDSLVLTKDRITWSEILLVVCLKWSGSGTEVGASSDLLFVWSDTEWYWRTEVVLK